MHWPISRCRGLSDAVGKPWYPINSHAILSRDTFYDASAEQREDWLLEDNGKTMQTSEVR